ncbi:hypothetical protein [Streptomyces sp. NPDC001155]
MSTDTPSSTQYVAQEARSLFQLLAARLKDADSPPRMDRWSVELWAVTEPEVRRHLLLLAAWEARTAAWNEPCADGVEGQYAREFTQCASSWVRLHPGEDVDAFCTGQHPAAFAASSLAFDRDDLLVSLATALRLIAHAALKDCP